MIQNLCHLSVWGGKNSNSSPSTCMTSWVTALHLHSTWPKSGGHPQSSVQRAIWSCGVDFNITTLLHSAMLTEAWTMYLKWSSPSRWRFKRVPDQRHLGRDRMAAALRPGQSLTRTKKQGPVPDHCCSLAAKTTAGKVCVNTGGRIECKWVVKEGHVKVYLHLKTLTQTWINTQTTTSWAPSFEVVGRAAECVGTQTYVKHSSCEVKIWSLERFTLKE